MLGVTTTRYVTKREYIIDNIIGFSVLWIFGFLYYRRDY